MTDGTLDETDDRDFTIVEVQQLQEFGNWSSAFIILVRSIWRRAKAAECG